MTEPRADRPHMPGYDEMLDAGSGLLPWSWAAERLSLAHNYWLAPLREPARRIEVETGTGEHYGGDRILRDHLFRGLESDPLGLQADSRAGAMSILTAIAANRSIATGEPVLVVETSRGVSTTRRGTPRQDNGSVGC